MRLTKANVLSMSTSENVRTGVLLYINDSIILQNRVQITSIDAQKRMNYLGAEPTRYQIDFTLLLFPTQRVGELNHL